MVGAQEAAELARAQEESLALRRSQRFNEASTFTKRFKALRALYPPDGGKQAVEVTALDMEHLEPLEFLNDTIIDFYIKVGGQR